MTQTAFILAAGKGTRLRPYTNNLPKPMVTIKGKPLIEHIHDKCIEIGIKNIIINLFYLGEKITNHFKNNIETKIDFSVEEKILDTGGGIKNALHLIKEEEFFLINGDAFWIDAPNEKTLQTVMDQWNPDDMDILLLLEPVENMTLTGAIGDYDIDADGRTIRSKDKTGKYMFTGVRLTKKSIFINTPDGPFSFLELMDKAQKNGKLYGVIHKGDWHHISTPQDLESVNEALNSSDNL